MNFLKKLFNPAPQTIIIVSGLPRSGTSMMMKMLESGGLELLTDHIRQADDDNPKGYYEFERVKKLPNADVAWLSKATGKGVKIIGTLLKYLPDTYTYKVIFMRRSIDEIIASQNKMMLNRGEDPSQVDDDEIAQLFEKHLAQIYVWLDSQPHIEYLNISYNHLLQDPLPAVNQINHFLEAGLDRERMVAVVDPALYRQRR